MKKVYVGCAITTVPEDLVSDFKNHIENLKEGLRHAGFEVLEFKTAIHPNATDTEVYTHDICDCVGTADAMLAICDHSSIGLGYEMATAIEKRSIPVLAVAHQNSKISKLVKGINLPNFKFMTYSNADEIVRLFLDFYKP